MNADQKRGGFVPPDGGYGWIVILATMAINISVQPLIQNFGIIFKEDFEKWGITSAQKSFLLHLHTAIYCCLGLPGAPLLKKYSFRTVALGGIALMCSGIFITSFAASYSYLIFSVSVLVGVGQGIMLPATYLAVNTYFKKRLTLAISLSVTGVCLSNLAIPYLCNMLIEHYHSTRVTVLALSGFSLVAVGCCFLLKPLTGKNASETRDEVLVGEKPQNSEPKEELELLTVDDGKVYHETTRARAKSSIFSKCIQLFNLELLSDTSFMVTIIGMSVSFASEINIIHMYQFILPDLANFRAEEVAVAVTVLSLADLLGRLVVPLIGHYFNVPSKIMYVASLITATLGRTGIALFFSGKTLIFVSVAFLGLAKGMKAVYQSVIIPKYVSLEKLPAANGLNMILTAISNLLIGTLIGAVKDYWGSYVYTLYAGSLISMLCVLLWGLFYVLYERRTKQT